MTEEASAEQTAAKLGGMVVGGIKRRAANAQRHGVLSRRLARSILSARALNRYQQRSRVATQARALRNKQRAKRSAHAAYWRAAPRNNNGAGGSNSSKIVKIFEKRIVA